jgi:phosphoglycolate phosphatase
MPLTPTPVHAKFAEMASPPLTGRLRAVLFDFDGTLADTYPGIAASVNFVRAGYGLPPISIDEVRRNVGRGPAYLMEQTVPAGDVNGNVERYKAHQPSVMLSGTHLFPGVADALAALKALSLKLGICSNKPRALTRELLAYFRLANLIDVALGPEDVALPKPAPEILKMALERLKVNPGEALYVGDMVVDIETARGAGVQVWVVATGSNDRATLEAGRPDRMLASLRDLPALLDGHG